MKLSPLYALVFGQLLRQSVAQTGNEQIFTAEDLCEGGDACPPFTNSGPAREDYLAAVGLLTGATDEESFEIGYDVLDENQFVEELTIFPLGDAGTIEVTGEIGIYNKVLEGQAGQRFATDGEHYMRIVRFDGFTCLSQRLSINFVVSPTCLSFATIQKSSSTTRFSLENDVNAIGFYLVDVGDWNSTAPTRPTVITTTFQGGNEKTYDIIPNPDPLLANGNAIFWGIIDTEPFDLLQIKAANNDAIGLDQLVAQRTVAPTSTAPVAPITPTTAAPVTSAPAPSPTAPPPVSKGKGFVLQSTYFYPVNKGTKSVKGKGYYQNYHFWNSAPAKGKGVITKGVEVVAKGKGVEVVAKGKGVEVVAKGKGVEVVAKGKGVEVAAKGLPPNYYYKPTKSAKSGGKSHGKRDL